MFILFNPLVIYASSVNGQFDIIPAVFLLLAWNSYKKNEDLKSGFYSGTAILFKQHVAIFIFYLTINLVKVDYKRIKGYFFGNLTIAVPVLVISSILNFQGLVEHAIRFHINRVPTGFSLTTAIYWGTYYLSRSITNEMTAGNAAGLTLTINTVLLFTILISLAIGLWRAENDDLNFLKTLILAYLVFFILNKSFFFHYFLSLFVIYIEYERHRQKSVSNLRLAWNLSLIPILGLWSAKIPQDIRRLLGTNFLLIFYVSSLSLHFLILYSLNRRKVHLLENKWIKYTYIAFLASIPLLFYAMDNFDPYNS